MIKKQKFEFAIYNEVVREAVRRGEHHKFFKDDWQNQHFIEIEAYSERTRQPGSARATPRIRAS